MKCASMVRRVHADGRKLTSLMATVSGRDCQKFLCCNALQRQAIPVIGGTSQLQGKFFIARGAIQQVLRERARQMPEVMRPVGEFVSPAVTGRGDKLPVIVLLDAPKCSCGQQQVSDCLPRVPLVSNLCQANWFLKAQGRPRVTDDGGIRRQKCEKVPDVSLAGVPILEALMKRAVPPTQDL